MRERDIEAYLVKRVKEVGGLVRKVQWSGRKGAPDRLVMFPKVWLSDTVAYCRGSVWVELKAPGKKPDPHQAREHDRMRAMCQSVRVIDSLEEVDAFLGEPA
jgi:hypothetical protein